MDARNAAVGPMTTRRIILSSQRLITVGKAAPRRDAARRCLGAARSPPVISVSRVVGYPRDVKGPAEQARSRARVFLQLELAPPLLRRRDFGKASGGA